MRIGWWAKGAGALALGLLAVTTIGVSPAGRQQMPATWPLSSVALADSVSYFMAIDGVAGESTDARHRGQIDLQGWSFGLSNTRPTDGAGTGRALCSGFSFTKVFDRASPSLMRALVSGTHVRSAVLSGVHASGTEFLNFTFTNLDFSSYQTAADAAPPMDSVAFQFGSLDVSYTPLKPDGTPGSAQRVSLSCTGGGGGGTPGTITGSVSDAGGPLQGIFVYAYPHGGTSPSASRKTAADGSYTFTGLGTTTYDILFLDRSGFHGAQWYSAVTAQPDATPITPPASAVNAILPTADILTGSVVDQCTNNPLSGVRVYVYPVGSNTLSGGATSKSDGTFRIPNLAAGDYQLYLFEPTHVYTPGWYLNAADRGSATTVHVAGGNNQALTVDILPRARGCVTYTATPT